MDYPDNYSDSFWIVRTVFWLSGKVPACFGMDMKCKEQYLPYCKNFPDFCKNFLDSNAATLTKFFYSGVDIDSNVKKIIIFLI